MRLCSIASGSSGNCVYVGSDTTHLLVDVGISGKRTEAGLAELGLTMRDIDAICITHEHADHISGLLSRMRNVSSRISPCIPYAPPTMPPTRWPTGSAMTGGGSGFSRIWAVIRTIPWNVCGIWIYCIWKQITMCICCRWDLIHII